MRSVPYPFQRRFQANRRDSRNSRNSRNSQNLVFPRQNAVQRAFDLSLSTTPFISILPAKSLPKWLALELNASKRLPGHRRSV